MTFSVEKLTADYEREKRDRHPPRAISDVPFAYEDITPEWLTLALCGGQAGAQVVSYELGAPDDGTSNRRRISVAYNEAGRAAGLPEEVFCKATQGLANRMLIGPLGAIETEVNFYNHVRPLLPIEAPVCCLANVNAALNSIVILRALDSRTEFCTHTTTITRQRAESQIRLLATLHGRFLESPELTASLSFFASWPEYFARLDPFFERPCDGGFGLAEEVIPARLFARRTEVWPATRKSVERHLALSQTLCHGDDHLRNWYVAANGDMGLADWQGVSRGHWARDVIYAIVTSLTVEQRRQWLPELLLYYQDQLQQSAGRQVPVDGMFDEMRRQLLSVLAFWTMTIYPQQGMAELVQPKDSTLEFIRRIAIAIDDLDAMDSFT